MNHEFLSALIPWQCVVVMCEDISRRYVFHIYFTLLMSLKKCIIILSRLWCVPSLYSIAYIHPIQEATCLILKEVLHTHLVHTLSKLQWHVYQQIF